MTTDQVTLRIRNAFREGRFYDIVRDARLFDLETATEPEQFYLAGLACLRLRRLDDALGHLQAAVMIDEWSGKSWLALAECWYELRQLGRAEHAWSRASTFGAMDGRARHLRDIARMARESIDVEVSEVLQRVRGWKHLVHSSELAVRIPDTADRLPVMFSLGADRRMEICLQIDDGPHPETTPVILDALRGLSIKAAFFVVGKSLLSHSSLIDSIVADGHEVYSHGYTHTPFTSLDDEQIVSELERTEVLLRRHRLTPNPYPIRLPGGMGWNDPRVHAAIMRWSAAALIVHWSIDPRDYQVPVHFQHADDLALEVRLRVREIIMDPAFSGPLLLTHDGLAGGTGKHPGFIRHFYAELADAIQNLGMKFAPLLVNPLEVGTGNPAPALLAQSPRRQADKIDILRIDSSNIADISENFDINGLPLPQYLATIRLSWINHKYPYAYALLKSGRFLGWLQAIYADRRLNGQPTTICNLSSWFVLEEFRSESLRLLMAAIKDAGDIPLTAHTPSNLAATIYKALRFHVTDSERFGLPLDRRGGKAAMAEPERIFLFLSSEAKKVFNDHRGLDIQHCMIRHSESSLYFCYKIRQRFDFVVADMLYADGDIDLWFGDWMPPDGSKLAQCQLLLIDRRFLSGRRPDLELVNPFAPRFYRGPQDLGPRLDFMYSEVPLYLPNMM